MRAARRAHTKASRTRDTERGVYGTQRSRSTDADLPARLPRSGSPRAFWGHPAYPIDAMPIPILLAAAYLAINLPMMVWLESLRAQGRAPARWLATLSWVLRFGPPLAGAIYLVALAGDWPFVVFVIAFFAGAFWMMNGLLAYTNPSPGSEPMRNGWDDRGTGAASNTDRDRS